jgi:biotin synthase
MSLATATDIDRLEEKVKRGAPLDFEDVLSGLAMRGAEQERLHALGSLVRDRQFGRRMFMRGVIEIGNACDVNCTYCGMRKDNRELPRYRMPKDEVLANAREIVDSGIRTVFLQSGEDRAQDVGEICDIIRAVKSWGDYTFILCLGIKTRDELQEMFDAGADKFILKHETANPDLFRATRPGTTLGDRISAINLLKSIGYKVGSGCIVGLPDQTVEDLAHDVLLIRELDVDMTSASPFIPNDQSPLRGLPDGDVELALNCVALMRIVQPRALIASVSAFDKLAPGAQVRALNAGANVMTMNQTPERYRESFVIYTTRRKVMFRDHIVHTLKAAGLELADYPE